MPRDQARAYFDAMPERERPRYQLLCDFQTFEFLDWDEREETGFARAELPQHVEHFAFILRLPSIPRRSAGIRTIAVDIITYARRPVAEPVDHASRDARSCT